MKVYEINDSEKIELPDAEPDFGKLNIGIMNEEELQENQELFGVPKIVVDDILSNGKNRNTLYTYENFSYGTVCVIDAADIFGERDRVAFFIKENLFLLIDVKDNAQSSIDKIFNSIVFKYKVKDISLEKIIFGFFAMLIEGHKDYIEDFAEKETQLEELLINDKVSESFSKTIFSMKKELLAFDTYYDQMINIAEELLENENGLYDEDGIRYFKVFSNKLTRLHDRVNNIASYLIHLSDAYQASLDHSINKTMKIFTVVTTIFLPLTLITGWYGMNFKYMPELHWKLGYYGVMVLSVAVAVFCLVLFKKKKWM